MQQLQIPMQARQLAAKLQTQNAKQIRDLTRQNTEMRSQLSATAQKLDAFKKIRVRDKVALDSKNKANKKLEALVRKTDARREAVQKDMDANAESLKIARQELAAYRSKKTVDIETKGMTPKQQISHLVSSIPCHGDSCKSMKTPISGAVRVKVGD